MYLNSFCCSSSQSSKCNSKIFRPWDFSGKMASDEKCPQKDSVSCCSPQDSTISTTTDEDVKEETSDKKNETSQKRDECGKVIRKEIDDKLSKCGEFVAIKNCEELKPIESRQTDNYSSDKPSGPIADPWSTAVHQDLLNLNLAQSLGMAPGDPFLLECLSQGYALEEYTRVLSQEHQAKILNARKQRPKKYRCPHCDVGFSNNGQLKGHIRIHTGERPFRCDEANCGKTFTRNEELTRHKRIHSGLRPFPCTHCGKRFGRKDHLKKHSRTHFQPRGLYAVPVMLPYETWTTSAGPYPYVPMFTY